mgnify:CR=1 FL=1
MEEIERLAYSPTEAARALGVSRPTVYAMIRSQGLRTLKVGTRTLIPADGLREWLRQQSEGVTA